MKKDTTKEQTHAVHGVAIIGCGGMGRVHAAAWDERDDAKILTVYDIDGARAKALAEKHGACVADSWQQAVEMDGVTMVSVCTPICSHPEITVFSANLGRHILCEKAIALTLQDADAMIEAAQQNEVKLAVAYQYRAFPRHRKVHELIQSGVLKGALFIRFEDMRGIRPKLAMHSRGGNGGPILDMAGHFFDLVRYYTGAEPVSVTAHGHLFGKSKPELGEVTDPALDAAEILVSYTDGHVLSVGINWGLPKDHPGYFGESMSASEKTVSMAEGRVSVRHADREVLYDIGSNPTGPAARISDLLDSVVNGTKPEVAGEDGRIALSVGLAALESIETGTTVFLDGRKSKHE